MSDFSAADRDMLAAAFPTSLADLPVPERMRAYVASLVRPGVALPHARPSPAPAAARGSAALAAFEDAAGTGATVAFGPRGQGAGGMLPGR